MVDREGRDKLIELIKKYLNCKIDNFQFDDALYNLEDSHKIDPVISKVNLQLYFIYDDLRMHWNNKNYKVSEEQLYDINRIVEFLETDLLFEWPPINNESIITKLKNWLFPSLKNVQEKTVSAFPRLDEAYWPFLNEEQYRMNKL